MLKEDLLVKIYVNERLMEEQPNAFVIPFGSEYSIYMQNLRNKQAVVSISIDGKDVLNGRRIIIPANDSVNLERFVEGMNKGNKFKFLKKTEEIKDFRGDNPEDGIVKITYQFEQQYIPPVSYPWYIFSSPIYSSPGYSDTGHGIPKSPYEITCSSCNCADSVSTAGVTGMGGQSNQSFVTGNVGTLESIKHVMSFQLLGTDVKPAPAKPSARPRIRVCTMCGKVFITEKTICDCGNNLESIA